MARDDYTKQESGGGLSDFEFEVTDAFFAPDPKYSEKAGSDILMLHWVGKAPGLDSYPLMTRDGFHPKWTLGADWQTMDGGKTVVHPKGKAKLGRAAGRMYKIAAEATEHLAGTDQDFLDQHDYRDASTWIGTRWYMEEVERDFGGQIGKKTELMPTRFLGFADGTGGGSGATATTDRFDSPVNATGESNSNGLVDQLKALAKALDSPAAFRDAAMKVPGVTDDTTLLLSIANDGPDGFYAQNH